MLPHPKYRADIDGLRAIAVLAVIAFHAFPLSVMAGYTGVDVFFVISGFLISTITFSSLEQGQFSFVEFYGRRIKRIFPSLIVVMITSYVFGWLVLFADEFAQLGKHITGGATFVSNFLLWSEAGYFDNASETKPLLHLWSLGIEEQFYILWPFLLWSTYKRHIGFLLVTLSILFCSFLLNLTAVLQHHDDVAFFSPYTRFWELMVGGVLAYLNIHKPHLITRKPNINATAGLLLLLGGLSMLRGHNAYPGYRALMPVMGTFLLISAGPNAWINRHIMANRLLVGIGLISYPLYLWHWVLFSYLWILEGGVPDMSTIMKAIALSFLLALITYWFIERTVKLNKTGAIMGINITMGLVVLMVLLGAIGFLTFKQDGVSSRVANSYARKYDEPTSFVGDPRPQTNSCQEMLGMPPISNESCLSNTKHPEYLILGDSHADSFYAAINMQGSSLPALKIAKSNTLPFVAYVTHRVRDSADHFGKSILVVNHALHTAAQYESIKTIVLVTSGHNYFSELNGIYKADTDEKLTLPAAERAFVAGYSDLISRFTGMGKRVIFVTEWPDLDYSPHSFIPRSFNLKSITHDDVMARVAVEKKQSAYQKLVSEIKRRNPGVLIYDTLPVFCDAINCRAKDEKNIYYIDKDHLSLSGSRRVLIDFLGWIKKQDVMH